MYKHNHIIVDSIPYAWFHYPSFGCLTSQWGHYLLNAHPDLQCTRCVSFFRGHGSLSTNPGVPQCWAMPMEKWHQGRRSQIVGWTVGSLHVPICSFLIPCRGCETFLNKMSTRCHKSFELKCGCCIWIPVAISGHQWPLAAWQDRRSQTRSPTWLRTTSSSRMLEQWLDQTDAETQKTEE